MLYTQDHWLQNQAILRPSGQSFNTIGGTFAKPGSGSVAQWTHIFGPRAISQATIGFSRNQISEVPTSAARRPAGLDIPSLFQANTVNVVPTITCGGGYSGTGVQGLTNNVNNVFTYRDDATLQFGVHTLKAGANLMRIQKFDRYPYAGQAGSFLGYAAVNYDVRSASANYNALQVNLRRRFEHGFSFGVAYTWSKAEQIQIGQSQFANELGLTPYDRRNILTMNYVWAPPYFADGNLAERILLRGWEFRMFDKRLMYEPSIRVPMMIRYPKMIRAGSVRREMVLDLDIAPTILEMAGVQPRKEMQGKSMVQVANGGDPSWRTEWLYDYYEYPGYEDVRQHRGIRTETHKLMHFYTVDEWEMYDLANDPEEKINLYNQPAHAERQQELTAALTRIFEAVPARVGSDLKTSPAQSF